jgi:type III pantothenate kinase
MAAPALLLVDAGNTRLKWATSPDGHLLDVAGDIATKAATSKWIASFARQFPHSFVVLATVVPKLRAPFRRAFGNRLVEVTSKLPELRFRYPKPSELGADRLAAAVAASAHGHAPAIIVACGTATAVTVLDADGRICGGVIAPGLEAQLHALLGATAQLPSTTLKSPKSALAKSTRDAIRAGVMLSFRGGVKEIVQELLKTLPAEPKPTVLLTGGNARHLVEHMEVPFKLRPLLVFEGLLIIGKRLFTPVP